MKASRLLTGLSATLFGLLWSSQALGLANRVFVSARSGNNANSCDNITTPCQTFAGAVTQLNPDGEVIVLDSGGYGPVTITQGVTIEAPAGVTAFIHPPSGSAITVNAPGATVTLRGLVLNGGSSQGIEVQAAGTLNVESCFITGFSASSHAGIFMVVSGSLNIKNTDVKACYAGLIIGNASGTVTASIDHCHLDGNTYGGGSATTSPGSSTTTATNSTANNNSIHGWFSGGETSGLDVLNLEFCTGSGNASAGLNGQSANASSRVRYSNCVFANNGSYGVERANAGTFESRGNNTITGNALGATNGTIGSFSSI